MYKITDELELNGFSINNLETVVKRNNGNYKFNSLEYFVIYITYKKSMITVDETQFTVEANHFVYIAPFKSITYHHQDLENTIITFSSSFYEKSTRDSFILNSDLFFNSHTPLFIAESMGSTFELKKLIVSRLKWYYNKKLELYSAVAHNCVEMLMLGGLYELEERSETTYKMHFSYMNTVNKFRVMLQKNFKTEKGVLFYSSQLGVTPQRLSIMTEMVLGHGAKKIIMEKVTAEAIKMLKNSTLNVYEIAMELGFTDEGNFSAYIKKQQGKTPREIREGKAG